jgi:hypothetical protein
VPSEWLSPGQSGGKSEVCLRPLDVMANPEPPGRLHTSTGSPYEERLDRSRGWALTSADPNCFGAFSVTDRATLSQADLFLCRPFKPRGFRTSHEPALRYRHTSVAADTTRRRVGSTRNP